MFFKNSLSKQKRINKRYYDNAILKLVNVIIKLFEKFMRKTISVVKMREGTKIAFVA